MQRVTGAERNRKQCPGFTFKVMSVVNILRDQVLEISPRNEEQVKHLVELEAEEHLQVAVLGGASVSQSDSSTVRHDDWDLLLWTVSHLL